MIPIQMVCFSEREVIQNTPKVTRTREVVVMVWQKAYFRVKLIKYNILIIDFF